MIKKYYVVLPKSLQQALKHGLELTKFHKVIKFKQEKWLKSYTESNAKLRANAKNDFEKEFSRLMNNVVFGKTMENMRKIKHQACNK